jgi:hypothetical protein
VRGLVARLAILVGVIAMSEVLPIPRARAQDAVVLSVSGAPDGLAREAREVVARTLAAEGLAVVPDAEVALRVAPARLAAVEGLEQGRAIAFELEARVVVLVAVWLREEVDPPAAASVVVSLAAGSRTFSATEVVGEGVLESAAEAAARDVIAQRTRALLIEGGTAADRAGTAGGTSRDAAASSGDPGAGLHAEGGSGPVASGAATSPSSGPGDAYDVIGPTMLGAFGLTGVGLGVFALIDGTCERLGASGACLRGEDPNVPAGVTLTIAGALAAAGAVVWFVTGATAGNQERIDVVVLPEGGAISARGRF